ncbi:MAG: D-alanine--D-alanine ligase family protein [Myxococcota bacterium]
MEKLRVGVIFGGISTEHEVSVVSATTVLKALDPSRYEPIPIGVGHDGSWRTAPAEAGLMPEAVFESSDALEVFPIVRRGLELVGNDGQAALPEPVDVYFPIIHGRLGEDGSLQGLLQVAGVPYVGAGVLASSVAMDKGITKRVLGHAGLPVLPWFEVPRAEALVAGEDLLDAIERRVGLPAFVKPANTGSSVGVHRIIDRAGAREALRDAARYDLRLVVEPGLNAREIECAVLGGQEPEASVLGEIVPDREFYDYESKYVSEGSQLLVPAPLDETVAEEACDLARRAFRAIGAWGMARVDFLMNRATGALYINELNTLPGFTEISMYPMLWGASGVPLPSLVDRLIELALERHREQRELEVRYSRS